MLLSWFTLTNKLFLEIHENKLKSVIKIQISNTSKCISLTKIVKAFYAFRVNVKKVCLPGSLKLINKYSQTIVGLCKGRRIYLPSTFCCNRNGRFVENRKKSALRRCFQTTLKLYCIVLYCVVLCCVVLCCVVLCCVVLCLCCVCVVLCCVVLCCVVLCCVVLCFVVLCCIVLYCIQRNNISHY